MDWLLGIVAIIAVALVLYDITVRGRRGAALAWSVAGTVVLAGAGIAKGADAPEPWPTAGLVAGLGLLLLAERARGRAGTEP